MAERLVILSDMWGAKKGLWIMSYLAYLQPYFDIEFRDCRQLANIDVPINTQENVYAAFKNGGMELAVSHLLSKEKTPAHYLTFCAGGTIAWDAGLKGMPMKSLYAISPIDLTDFSEKPDCPVTLVFGEDDQSIPEFLWADEMGLKMEHLSKYGHELYSDEKIISKVCQDILENFLKEQYQR
ncbi:MAG: hypothetical protein HKN89_03650 [Eudoraea sp.]|nr:hypothetical protein [Eudoraea sp.]